MIVSALCGVHSHSSQCTHSLPSALTLLTVVHSPSSQCTHCHPSALTNDSECIVMTHATATEYYKGTVKCIYRLHYTHEAV